MMGLRSVAPNIQSRDRVLGATDLGFVRSVPYFLDCSPFDRALASDHDLCGKNPLVNSVWAFAYAREKIVIASPAARGISLLAIVEGRRFPA